jgi:hypothetical protein
MDKEQMLRILISKGVITQEQFDQKVEEAKKDIKENPKGVHAVIQANVGDNYQLAEAEIEMKKRIDNGEITSANFGELTVEEQEIVKLVLFKQYSPKKEQTAKSLSGIEFLAIMLVKFLDKTMDKTLLTVEEQSLFDTLVTIINKNDMPINDTTDWRFAYFDYEFTKVQNNRNDYFAKKMDVTGTF